MIPEQITKMVATGESETLEFKATTGTRRQATETLCAMLNHRGGCIIFGVTPEGDVVGQQVSDQTVKEVSDEIQRIEPPVFPTIERIPLDTGKETLVVRVTQGHMKPYTYKGDAYRRVGNTTLAMSRDDYNQALFDRMHSEQRWENQPAVGWSVNDLDLSEILLTVEESIRRIGGNFVRNAPFWADRGAAVPPT